VGQTIQGSNLSKNKRFIASPNHPDWLCPSSAPDCCLMGTKGIPQVGGSFVRVYHWEKKAPKYLMNNGWSPEPFWVFADDVDLLPQLRVDLR
jgi:hypothetical protein